MEFDGIFLDLYGTLTAGDREAVETVCRSVVQNSGVPLTAHELSVIWGNRFFDALDHHNGDDFLTLFDLEVKTLRETMAALKFEIDPRPYVEQLSHYWQNPELHPEVCEFLAALELPICIVSNADRADADATIELHHLPIDHLVTSEDARSYKPDRAIFDLAFDKTGWRRERVMHVGDSLQSDVGGAIAAGIRSGWVNRAHRIHDVGTYRPDHEFKDLWELEALLRTNGRGS